MPGSIFSVTARCLIVQSRTRSDHGSNHAIRQLFTCVGGLLWDAGHQGVLRTGPGDISDADEMPVMMDSVFNMYPGMISPVGYRAGWRLSGAC